MCTLAKAVGASRRALLLKLGVGLGAASLFASPAHAVSCGDVVGPGGVTRLTGDLACDQSPGLTVEGPVVLDLQGHTLSCVSGGGATLAGTGIDLIGHRGRVRNGTIANCDKGVVVEGDGRHRLARLTVTSPGVSGGDGIAFQVKSSRNRFIGNIAAQYAGEGFRLGDDDVPADRNLLTHNDVNNAGNHGFRVRLGERNLLWENQSEANAAEGFRSQDKDNRFIGNTANGNGDEGIRLRDEETQNNLVLGNHVQGNGLEPCNPFPPDEDANPGIAVVNEASGNRILNNDVQGNCIGIAVEEGSLSNAIRRNVVSGSRLVDLADGNADCDQNVWRGNAFGSSIAGPPPGEMSPACIR